MGAGSMSSGSGKSTKEAARAKVVARLALTAPLQAGSTFRSSARAAASTRSSSGSRLAVLREVGPPVDLTRVAARPLDIFALPLLGDLARFLISFCSEPLSALPA